MSIEDMDIIPYGIICPSEEYENKAGQHKKLWLDVYCW